MPTGYDGEMYSDDEYEEEEEYQGFFSKALDVFEEVVTNGQDTLGAVFSGGQQAVVDVAGVAGGVVTNGQNVVGGAINDAGETAEEVLDPVGLLGLGSGLAFGGTLAAAGLAIGGGLLADELLAGGAGRMALIALVKGKRSRR